MLKVFDADLSLKEQVTADVPHDATFTATSGRPDERLLALMYEIEAEFPGISREDAREIAKQRNPALVRAYTQS